MTVHDDGIELMGGCLDFGGLEAGYQGSADVSDCSTAALEGDAVAAALRAQLERVLELLWSLPKPAVFSGDSLTTAQLAMQLSSLYPQFEGPSERVALDTRVLELYPHEAQLARKRVRVTRLESELLQYLIKHRDRVISRDELMQRVWGKRLTGAAARTVDIHIHRLRSKLGTEFARRVETIRQVGYRFSSEPDALRSFEG